MNGDRSHKPRHECGVFAVYGHTDAALLTYYGLFALQHRGQESAGMVTAQGPDQPFIIHRGMGLVSQVFLEMFSKMQIAVSSLLDNRASISF